jgi:predicted mannosyl-3-phosphoglycerate phosphatase (HAD superfamily)
MIDSDHDPRLEKFDNATLDMAHEWIGLNRPEADDLPHEEYVEVLVKTAQEILDAEEDAKNAK